MLISNPVAGKGKPLQNIGIIKTFLNEKEYEINEYLTQQKSDYSGIEDFINSIKNPDLLIISGGDGTLNDVVNVLPEDFLKPIIVLPCGSGNDFATWLYGKKSLIEILKTIEKNETVGVNIGLCNGKKFINGLGIGFDGWVAQKAAEGVKFIHPSLKYYTAILRGIFTFRSFETNIGSALIIAVANGPTYGGGFKIAPNADPTDNLFDLWHIKPIEVLKRILYLDIIKKGKHKPDGSTFEHKKINEIKIVCKKPVPAHLDGEYMLSDVFEVKLCSYKLNFLK